MVRQTESPRYIARSAHPRSRTRLVTAFLRKDGLGVCLRYLTTEVGSDRGYYRIDAATGRVDPARTKNLSEAATLRGLGPRGCRSRDVSALLVRKAYGLPDKWERVKRTKVCGGCLGT